MRKVQFSLLGLLTVVSFAAVACAALARPNPWWASGLMTATVAALVVAALAAAFRHGRPRPFAGGFALVGGAYLLLVFGPGFAERVGPWLLTSRALAYVEAKRQADTNSSYAAALAGKLLIADVSNNGDLEIGLDYSAAGTSGTPFVHIGQSLWTLLFALLGGLVARRWASADPPPL